MKYLMIRQISNFLLIHNVKNFRQQTTYSYNLKTIIRIFSMLQCDKTSIIYNENQPNRPIILQCELAKALITPIRFI